jgi:hypothetical protein
VRLSRKLPASGSVTLLSTTAVTIPAYTVFESSGTSFFNRSAIILAPATPQIVDLFQGSVVVKTAAGLDEDYQMFFSSEDSFSVSDIDVQVVLNALIIKKVTSGLWNLKFTQGFTDKTLPDGRLAIQFGTSFYGSKPSANDNLVITYVVTDGATANSYAVISKSVASSSYPTVTASFLSNLSGGADQRTAITYKNVGAPTFGSFGSAISGPQYQNAAKEYPGVVDAVTFAQREVNPSAVEWMNLTKVVLLTSTIWTAAQKTLYLNDLQTKTMYSGRFFLEDPVAVPVNIDLTIYCYNWANATQVQLNVTNAITNLLLIQAGVLSYDYYLSDLSRSIKDSDPGVEYFEINLPTSDIIVSAQAVVAPTEVVTAGLGTLAASTYYYSVGVTLAAGVVTTRNWTTVTTVALTSQVQLSWPAVPGAISYQVYGRGPSGSGLMSSQVGTTFLDDGTILPGLPPPPQNSVPVRYASLASLVVTPLYSSRQTRV